jgi:hypothetical protein
MSGLIGPTIAGCMQITSMRRLRLDERHWNPHYPFYMPDFSQQSVIEKKEERGMLSFNLKVPYCNPLKLKVFEAIEMFFIAMNLILKYIQIKFELHEGY